MIKVTIEKQNNQSICEHDWAYDKGEKATLRKCTKCERVERRDFLYTLGIGESAMSNWYLKIDDVFTVAKEELNK